MKLDRLIIRGSKNLTNFEINFDETTLTTVLVGENGSGKSNLLEVIVKIFEHLDDLRNTPSFSYEISYIIHNEHVKVQFDGSEKSVPSILVTNSKHETITYGRYSEQHKDRYLPNVIFGYYSGVSERFANTFKPYQDAYEKKMRAISSSKASVATVSFRRFFFAKNYHSQYVLLSLLVDPSTKVKDFLRNELNISELDSVLFVLKEPEWYRSEWRKQSDRDGDERFWYARGRVPEFLSKVFAISLAPLFSPSTNEPKNLYLYIHNPQALANLVQGYGGLRELRTHKAFFGDLDLAYIADLIDRVIIQVKLKNSGQIVSFDEMSEGEQQLLTVLGLLRLTKED
ncbi:hypothetical protein EG832_05580, partial [bacterium]|nr:hypothetical protein [bacterium]